MKRLLFLTIFLLGTLMQAQSSHSVTVTWTASSDAASNPTLTYNIYRAPAACGSVPPLAFAKVGTVSAGVLTFTDSAAPLGSNCYVVTSLVNGLESVNSNTAPAVILPAAPTSVLVTKTT